MDNKELVWKQTLDNKYRCYVERKDSHNGVLKIDTMAGQNLYSNDVTISFGGTFGPDFLDVEQWQQTCIEFVDSLPSTFQ